MKTTLYMTVQAVMLKQLNSGAVVTGILLIVKPQSSRTLLVEHSRLD